MKWNHSRKGVIEGKIVEDYGDVVEIELVNEVWMGSMIGYSKPGDIITVRKAFLQLLEEKS